MITDNIADTHGTLGALLRRPFEVLLKRVYQELAESGFPDIRPAHSSVFRTIGAGGSRIVDLASRAGMTKQSMAYLVEDLRSRGYLELVADPSDGRAKLARLSERGEAVQHRAMAISRRMEQQWAEQLAPGEMARLREILSKLGECLEH